MSQRISAVIITLNEERNIARCLQSLQGIVDEILVVDSGSTDNTVAISQSYGVKVVTQAWLGYGAQKNFANLLAAYDVILSMDADEALSDELKIAILDVKRQSMQNKAYSMNRLTNYCGKWIRHGSWYPDVKVRIFNRTQVHWKESKVHEELEFNIPVSVCHLKGDIIHYSYYSDEEFIARSKKYSILSAEEYYKKGKKVGHIMQGLKTFWAFFTNYFIKLGFLDGKAGFTISRIIALSTYDKYKQLRVLQRKF